MSDAKDLTTRFYPERAAGGYSSVDGTIEFYGRVNALVKPGMRGLDYGAGRAEWYEDDGDSYRSQMRDLRSKVKSVVACDVDAAVLGNRSVDENVVIEPGCPLPFEDREFDLIVSDWVFEHLDDPHFVAAELDRVLQDMCPNAKSPGLRRSAHPPDSERPPCEGLAPCPTRATGRGRLPDSISPQHKTRRGEGVPAQTLRQIHVLLRTRARLSLR